MTHAFDEWSWWWWWWWWCLWPTVTTSGSKWIEWTIRQAHLAAQGQLKIGAQAAQSTLLRYERRCTELTWGHRGLHMHAVFYVGGKRFKPRFFFLNVILKPIMWVLWICVLEWSSMFQVCMKYVDRATGAVQYHSYFSLWNWNSLIELTGITEYQMWNARPGNYTAHYTEYYRYCFLFRMSAILGKGWTITYRSIAGGTCRNHELRKFSIFAQPARQDRHADGQYSSSWKRKFKQKCRSSQFRSCTSGVTLGVCLSECFRKKSLRFWQESFWLVKFDRQNKNQIQ